MKIADKLYNMLTSRVTPMIYIFLLMSVYIGFTFATGLIVGSTESILYASGVLVQREIWGGLLFVAAVGCIVSLYKDWWEASKLFDLACFLLWFFATIALAVSSHWYVFVTVGLFHILFHIYLYLGLATGTIQRKPAALSP